MEKVTLDALPEFLIGQVEDTDAMTGCTAIVVPKGAVCGVDVRGGSPGTRDIAALDPRCNRKEVHGVMLSGGSSYGLDAACGLMNLLEEKKIGRPANVTVIPNVCCCVLFDLLCGSSSVRPDAKMGRAAGENAFAHVPFKSGNYGAGCGATVGKPGGLKVAMKGGIGQAAFKQGDLIVTAVVAVNCVGDVVENGRIIAGARDAAGGFAGSEEIILSYYNKEKDLFADNTVIGCIMTNANINKAQAGRIAARGQDAIAKTICPSHSIYDGDTILTLASGKVDTTIDALGILAEHAVSEAIIDAVKSAESYGDYISYKDYVK